LFGHGFLGLFSCQSGLPFRKATLCGWVLLAATQSCIIYFVCYTGFGYERTLSNGNAVAMWGFSILCTTVCIIVVNLKAALISQHWTVGVFPGRVVVVH
jgi:magnesium-transporting ATPase (P-type)